MEKYLIEVPHGGDKASCLQAVQVFLASGSHFVTHAEWGCRDGDHKAWLMVEVKDRTAAERILPSAYQRNAKITKISKFTREDLQGAAMNHHS